MLNLQTYDAQLRRVAEAVESVDEKQKLLVCDIENNERMSPQTLAVQRALWTAHSGTRHHFFVNRPFSLYEVLKLS